MLELGHELGDAQSCETFQAEALLERDFVELRLAIAREGAVAFQDEAARAVVAELQKSRLPSAAEIIAVLWSLVKAESAGLKEASHLLGNAAATGRSLASAMKGLNGAAEELRQGRTGMLGKFAAAFERGGGLARQGGQGLKRQNMLAMYTGFSLFVFAGLGGGWNIFICVASEPRDFLAPFEYALIEGAMFIALSSLFFGHELY